MTCGKGSARHDAAPQTLLKGMHEPFRPRPTAMLVTSFPGDPTVQERRDAAAQGTRPRKDFVELADALGNVVIIDTHYMSERASRAARVVLRLAGMPAAQVVEVFLRRRRFGRVIAWGDRLGIGLAVLLKLGRARVDLVLISVLLTRGAKGLLVRRLGITSHLSIIMARSYQKQLLEHRYGVEPAKLRLDRQGVDERFFSPPPDHVSKAPIACVVGLEERDHATLIDAARGLRGRVELAVGTIAEALDAPAGRARIEELLGRPLPENVGLGNYTPPDLRSLYARATCAIVVINDIDFDAGVTASTEAMAMGLPIVATRTRGLADLFTHEVEGLFVEPGDATALRGAVQRLLDDPERAGTMGAAARRLVERCHRLDDCLAPIAEAVRSV